MLKFDDKYKSQNDWKWQNIETKWSKRGYISAAMITDNNLICCGGTEYRQDVDIYSFVDQKMTQLAEMNNMRTCAGICIDNYKNRNVYVGGGDLSPKAFECYHAAKNKWISSVNTKNEHKKWPIIWNEAIPIQ